MKRPDQPAPSVVDLHEALDLSGAPDADGFGMHTVEERIKRLGDMATSYIKEAQMWRKATGCESTGDAREQRQTIDALPKTADGKAVVFGSLVWTRWRDSRLGKVSVYRWEVTEVNRDGLCMLQQPPGANPVTFWNRKACDLYSSEEAARLSMPT